MNDQELSKYRKLYYVDMEGEHQMAMGEMIYSLHPYGVVLMTEAEPLEYNGPRMQRELIPWNWVTKLTTHPQDKLLWTEDMKRAANFGQSHPAAGTWGRGDL